MVEVRNIVGKYGTAVGMTHVGETHNILLLFNPTCMSLFQGLLRQWLNQCHETHLHGDLFVM